MIDKDKPNTKRGSSQLRSFIVLIFIAVTLFIPVFIASFLLEGIKRRRLSNFSDREFAETMLCSVIFAIPFYALIFYFSVLGILLYIILTIIVGLYYKSRIPILSKEDIEKQTQETIDALSYNKAHPMKRFLISIILILAVGLIFSLISIIFIGNWIPSNATSTNIINVSFISAQQVSRIVGENLIASNSIYIPNIQNLKEFIGEVEKNYSSVDNKLYSSITVIKFSNSAEATTYYYNETQNTGNRSMNVTYKTAKFIISGYYAIGQTNNYVIVIFVNGHSNQTVMTNLIEDQINVIDSTS
jgi:hypothetical protein